MPKKPKPICAYRWESVPACVLDFHACCKEKHSEDHHECYCGERLKIGQAWEVGSCSGPANRSR